MLTQDKINKEDWKEKFFERFGGEGTIAKTDENCILIAFTKKEVIDFIETLLKEQRDEVIKVVNVEKDKILKIIEKYYVYCNEDGSYSYDPSGNQLLDMIKDDINLLSTLSPNKENKNNENNL